MRSLSFSLGYCWFLSSLLFVPPVDAKSCEVIGRVMPGAEVLPGKALCISEAFQFADPVRVACTKSRKVVLVRNKEDLIQCLQPRKPDRPCSLIPQQSCDRMRSAALDKPTLLQPFGDTLLDLPKFIRWAPVSGANSYTVTMLTDQTFKFRSSQTSLKLPTISVHDSVQFVVEAFRDAELLGSSIKTFNFLDARERRQLEDDLELIRVNRFSEQEQLALRLSIFSEVGLINNGIALVEKQILQKAENPFLIRQLAELYLDAGLYHKAFDAYTKTKKIALKLSDKDEVRKAEDGLRLVASLLRYSKMGAYQHSTSPEIGVTIGIAKN